MAKGKSQFWVPLLLFMIRKMGGVSAYTPLYLGTPIVKINFHTL